jgi:LemA protein
MSDSVTVWLALAVLLFWAMGAYNRLGRLRLQRLQAFAVLDGLLRQYPVLLNTAWPSPQVRLAQGDERPVSGEVSAAWAALAVAVESLAVLPKGTHVSSLNGTPIETVCAALDAVAQAWTRLQALPPDQIGPVLAPTLVLQWTQLGAQTDAARSEFNQRVVNYNEAIQQFPALLLAWVLGFKPAQPI